jgi:hypothetical protein
MSFVGEVAAGVIGGVLLLSGLTKVFDREGSRRAVHNLAGLVKPFEPAAATCVPFIEIGLAVTLLLPTAAEAAAWCTALLFGAYAGIVAISLARGLRPECRCFGRLHTKPIGLDTLTRNFVLLALAAFVALNDNALHNFSWRIRGLSMVLSAGLTASVLTGGHRAYWRGANHEVGAADGADPEARGMDAAVNMAPPFTLPDSAGARHDLADLLSDKVPLVLLFSEPDCSSCDDLMFDSPAWRQSTRFNCVIVGGGDFAANKMKAVQYGISTILVDEEREIADVYEIYETPQAVVIDTRGIIENRASGPAAIRDLLNILERR